MGLSKKRMAEVEFDCNVDSILEGNGIDTNDKGVELMYKGVQLFKLKKDEYEFEEFMFYVENFNPTFEVDKIKDKMKELIKSMNKDLKGKVNVDMLNLRDIFEEKVLKFNIYSKDDYILFLARYCFVHYLLVNSGKVEEV